ncbi:hypothetical protein [Streptomyces sp. NPDC000410]|uniref:WD40 repeat domain-containing protein n=1 Tax=Streptomyces sp. NPDC000410 TaxID=3154254 RepID=UPI003326FEC6
MTRDLGGTRSVTGGRLFRAAGELQRTTLTGPEDGTGVDTTQHRAAGAIDLPITGVSRPSRMRDAGRVHAGPGDAAGWLMRSPEEGAERIRTGHTAAVNGIAITPDGARAVTASEDRTAMVWDLARGQCLYTLTGHIGAVDSVVVAQDGPAITASEDGTFRVWDIARGECLQTINGHSQSVLAYGVTPDRTHAITAYQDGPILAWDLSSGRQTLRFAAHSAIRCIALTVGTPPKVLCGTEGGDVLCLEIERERWAGTEGRL